MTALAYAQLEAILGRPEHEIPLEHPLSLLARQRVLVTGALGSLGRELVPLLDSAGIAVLATDILDYDVTNGAPAPGCDAPAPGWIWTFGPTLIVHLAGAKHAPDGELDPAAVATTNVLGTKNVLDLAAGLDVPTRVVLASTCKAADPETAYGASKLLAERMVLNAGGTVARFYNVVETSGNVFERWSGLHSDAALPVAPCRRYFISLREAVALLVTAATLPAGRYTVQPGQSRSMRDVAHAFDPMRWTVGMNPRRGDRPVEPRHAECERLERVNEWIDRIVSPHDPTS